MRDLESMQEQQEPIAQIIEGEDGHPVQTIPHVVMCDRAGHELEVLRWTGRTSTPESQEAGRQNIVRLIQQAGYMLRESCPASGEFGRPAVDLAQGEQPCKQVDRAAGCRHYQVEQKRRRAAHEELERKNAEAFATPTQAMVSVAETLHKHFEREATLRTPDPDAPPGSKRGPRG